MKNDAQDHILTLPFNQLPVIPELKRFMQDNELNNITDLLQFTGAELIRMDGFSYRCLLSYMNLLDDHKCLHLFKET